MSNGLGAGNGNGWRVLAAFIGGLPWAIATIFAIGFGYSKIQTRLDGIDARLSANYPTRTEIQVILRESDHTHAEFDKRLDRIESLLRNRLP